MLRDCPNGGYRFLPGISAFSSGTVAMPGHEIVHVTLASPLPGATASRGSTAICAAENRPRTALCGIELRSPQPFTFDGFAEFNEGYRGLLKEWNILVGEDNPIPRTNVAPVAAAPSEPSLYAFAYTVPGTTPAADLHRGRRRRDARPRAGPGGHRPPRGHVAGRDAREGALRDGR